MGQYVTRYWDGARGRTRKPRAGDPSEGLFAAYRPHTIAGWTPELARATWSRVQEAERAVDSLAATGQRLPAAAWLLVRSESSASSTIEGIRSTAWRMAEASAGLTPPGERLASADVAALRNVARDAAGLGVRGVGATGDGRGHR